MSFQNPINALLIPPILYLLSLIIYPSHPSSSSSSPNSKDTQALPSTYDPAVYNWLPAKHPDVLVYKKYTPKELAVYDGKESQGGRILLAIQRVKGERTVFDVGSGRGFYGPGTCLSQVWRVCMEGMGQGEVDIGVGVG
jgi:membrane-associated progesterone receptor component